MTDLLPCPFCGSAIGLPFPNLRDGDDDDGCPVSCWTIQHTCAVTKGTIWAEGDERSDCVSAWNTRAHLPGEPQEASQHPAEAVIAQIEQRFPNWRSFRDLVDCIDCTLHDLRNGSGK